MSNNLSIIIFLSISLITQQRIIHIANEPQCYGVMFDAGSSGTRASVYSWPCREIQNVPKVNINQVPYKKAQPGISAFDQNIEGLVQYFAPLIEFAKQTVPQDKINATPIMLGATAGMRLLPEEDQLNIIEKVRIIFKQSGFYFPNKKWARVISGQQEANYLWLSINYLKGTLFTEKVEDSYNTLDLGGASTQIAIRQQRKNKLSKDYVVDDNDNFLYGKSYLGYGNDVTRNEIINMSIEDQSKIIKSPCFNQGYQGEWVKDKSYTIQGTGNPDACVELINKYIEKDIVEGECKEDKKFVCTIQNQKQPRIVSSDKFIAVSTFLYSAQSFSLDKANITTLSSNSYNFCRKNWTDVLVDPQYKSNPYAYAACFQDLYSSTLLKNGYKLPTDLGVEPGWTLAGVFYQIQLSSCKNESPVCQKFKEFF